MPRRNPKLGNWKKEDCYDDDGNVIEDCMERLRQEEMQYTMGSDRYDREDHRPPKRVEEWRESEKESEERKWGKKHFDEETARRKGRDDAFGGKGFSQASPLQRKKPPHGGEAGNMQQDRRTGDIIRRRKIV